MDLLRNRPDVGTNWIALALALHLSGDSLHALGVLNSYIDNLLPDSSSVDDADKTELVLYKCRLLVQLEMFSEALRYLTSLTFKRGPVLGCLEVKGTTCTA